jgi:hypothetical protein
VTFAGLLQLILGHREDVVTAGRHDVDHLLAGDASAVGKQRSKNVGLVDVLERADWISLMVTTFLASSGRAPSRSLLRQIRKNDALTSFRQVNGAAPRSAPPRGPATLPHEHRLCRYDQRCPSARAFDDVAGDYVDPTIKAWREERPIT